MKGLHRLTSSAALLGSIIIGTCSAQDKPGCGVWITKDDAAVLTTPTRHLFVGEINPVESQWSGSESWISLNVDNGKIDSFFSNVYPPGIVYALVPEKPGQVIVSSIQIVCKGGRCDSMYGTDTFEAILYPAIAMQFEDSRFATDSVLSFVFIDRSNGNPLPSRYQVGPMYVPKICSNDTGACVGFNECFGQMVDLRKTWKMTPLSFKTGDSIRIRLLVRDMETDLLIFCEPGIYVIRK